MVADGGTRSASRSRSPPPLNGKHGEEIWKKGSEVQWFMAADPLYNQALYVSPTPVAPLGPHLLQSHGWFDGTLLEDFDPKSFVHLKKETWPCIEPSKDLVFMDRKHCKPVQQNQRRIQPEFLRQPVAKKPLLSVVFIRWGGEDAVPEKHDSEESNDGDWGVYGCPASNGYMSAVVKEGLMRHPRLNSATTKHKFEVFSLFVKHSEDVRAIGPMTHYLKAALRGKKTATFWMLWPAEWIDCRGSDYAAYIERRSLFTAMRACEEVGLRTAFPHPADQYEHITSKSWMATLSMQKEARLPAAVMVSKANVLANVKRAAKTAMAGLKYVRSQNPYVAGEGETASPSEVNKDGVFKGVVKLGWSWEARYVKIFKGEEDLAAKLADTFSEQGCLASTAVVQEWVDFDYEMRLYFLPPDDWDPSKRLEPTRIECNAWSGTMDNGERRNFHKLNKEKILAEYWKDDEKAYESAKEQAISTAQFLLGWLLLNDAAPVPMIRMDFMLLRTGPAKARIFFGEYCEMGACCLGWQEGPPTIWRAAIDNALR